MHWKSKELEDTQHRQFRKLYAEHATEVALARSRTDVVKRLENDADEFNHSWLEEQLEIIALRSNLEEVQEQATAWGNDFAKQVVEK